MNKKLYCVIAIGKPKMDSNNHPELDENKKPIIEFVRTAKAPSKDFKRLANRPASKLIQIVLMEDVATTAQTADGETVLIANPVRKPFALTVFQSAYPSLYPLLEKQVTDPKGYIQLTPEQRYLKILVPGLIDTFEVPEHYRMTRNAETGIWEEFKRERRNPVSGKIEETSQLIASLTEFWYGDEAENLTIMRKQRTEALMEYAHLPRKEGTRSNKDQVLEDAEHEENEHAENIPAAVKEMSEQIGKGQVTEK